MTRALDSDLSVLSSPEVLEDHQCLLYQEDLEVLDDLWDLGDRPHLKDARHNTVVYLPMQC